MEVLQDWFREVGITVPMIEVSAPKGWGKGCGGVEWLMRGVTGRMM